MSKKREKYATRILNDFSQLITPELYWKLYIFAYYSNSKPHYIIKNMKKELDSISINQYPKLDLESLKKECEKYDKNNNAKINHVKTFKKICDLPRLLHISQLTKIINECFPSPYAAGFIEAKWTSELKDAVKKYYFDSSVPELHFRKALNNVDLLKHYLSHLYYDFFYVHIQIAEHKQNHLKYIISDKAERRYDYTYVAMLLSYDKANSKPISFKPNHGAYARKNDYKYDLDKILAPLIKEAQPKKRPLLFIHNSNHKLQDNFILDNSQPHRYSLYCFEDFSTVSSVLKDFALTNSNLAKNLYDFLCVMEKCRKKVANISFNFNPYDMKNSNNDFEATLSDTFRETMRYEQKKKN